MVAKEASGENNGLRSQSKICRSGARLFSELVIFSVDCDGKKDVFTCLLQLQCMPIKIKYM